MDEQAASSAPVVDSAPITSSDAPEPTGSPEPAESNPQESDNQPERTDPEPQTPMPDQPDHGINPDEGIDPDQGDQPTDPDHNTAGEPVEQVDLSKMTRRERAEYFAESNQQSQRQIDEAVNAVYQPQSADELTEAYMEDGYSQFEANILARETIRDQEKQIAEARAEIAEVNMAIQTDAVEVMSTLDWANPINKTTYDAKTAEVAGQLYQELATVKDPRTGQIIDTKMPLKTFYGLVDQIRSASSAQAGLKAQKAAEAQMAAVAPGSSSSQTRETPFDQLSLEQQKAKLQAQGHYVT